MKNRRFVLALLLAILTTAVFAGEKSKLLSSSAWHNVPKTAESRSLPVEPSEASDFKLAAPVETQSPAPISEHVVYGLLFREMAAFKRKAQELEAQGKDGSLLSNYHKKRAGLNDAQGAALDKIGGDCQKDVDDLEGQAKRIIDNDRALHPGGRLQPGESLPNPPPQLKELEQRRTAAIMNAKGKLRTAFGNAEFQRFDEFERNDVAARAKPIPRPPHPIRTPGSNLNFNRP